jgi:hypothetical protein
MSHIVEIRTEIRDAAAVTAACHRLQLPQPVHKTARLFVDEAAGLAIELPGWRYPVVCDLATGQVRYDNYLGYWGEQRHLDAFLQAYAVEKAKIEARKQGHSSSEQQLADGSIKLTIQLSRGAT